MNDGYGVEADVYIDADEAIVVLILGTSKLVR